MTARTKSNTKASPNGRPSQPKAGSPAQREMAGQIADRVMANDLELFNTDLAMNENGHGPDDLAFSQGRKVHDVEGEHVTYRQHKATIQERNKNLEASYPTLMPVARKLIRKARKEADAQE